MIDSARFSHRASLQATLAADTGSTPVTVPAQAADAADVVASSSMEDYQRLQRRLLLATLALSALVSLLTWFRFGTAAACSLIFGASCGLLYLRLLARSVARLGSHSRSVGRFQILVPALLVIVCARVPALQLLPALAGFVLYKPALLLQAFIAP